MRNGNRIRPVPEMGPWTPEEDRRLLEQEYLSPLYETISLKAFRGRAAQQIHERLRQLQAPPPQQPPLLQVQPPSPPPPPLLDEDEEDNLKKGYGKRVDVGVVSTSAPAVQSVPQPKATYSSMAGYSSVTSVPVGPSIGGAIGASQGSNAMSIKAQAEIAKKALEDNVMKLKESHGRTMLSLTKTDENLSASLLNITAALEKSLSAADEKYKLMQKLRDFVSLICDFLQVKATHIEELEEEMQKVHEQRASATLERRSAADDEIIEVEAAVKAAMSIFSKEGSSAEIIAAAKSAAQAASAAVREQSNLPVKLDEFGRDMNLKKRMDIKGRSEARERRRIRYESKRLSSMEVDSPHRTIEGESSTDESDSESEVYRGRRQLVLEIADQVFADAAEEYSQLSVVKERFEEWKREYASSYRDAYMSLSAPVIFSPYVRLELLKWDPLREKPDFLHMSWYFYTDLLLLLGVACLVKALTIIHL